MRISLGSFSCFYIAMFSVVCTELRLNKVTILYDLLHTETLLYFMRIPHKLTMAILILILQSLQSIYCKQYLQEGESFFYS